MTDHADLSLRLALAIGWPEHLLHAAPEPVYGWRVWAWCEADPGCAPKNRPPWWPWRPFDYRDPAVIWPIAERYNAFPVQTSATRWCASCRSTQFTQYAYADTAAEAVARAVVGARG